MIALLRRLTLPALLFAAAGVHLPAGAGAADVEGGAAGQFVVERLEISGARGISPSALASLLATYEGGASSRELLEDDLARIVSRYRDEGYLDAEISVRLEEGSRGGAAVEILIDEGPRYMVGRVSIMGLVSLDPEKVSSSFDTRSGRVFRPRLLEEDIEQLLTHYDEIGHPFARVDPGPFVSTEVGLIDIALSVDEGPRVLIHDIRVEGNEITQKGTVARAFGLPPPQLYSRGRIEQGKRRLRSLALLPEVPVVEIDLDESSRGLLWVRMVEGPTNSVTGVIGYAPGEGSAGDRFTGFADVDLANLLGTGRRAGLHWRRVTSERSLTGIAYREPWVVGSRFDLGLNVNQMVDLAYVETEAGASLQTGIARALDLGAEVSLGRVIFEEASRGSWRTYSAALIAAWDSRDVLVNPRRGVEAKGSIEYTRSRRSSGEGADDGSDLALWKASSSIGRFFPVGADQVLFLRGGVAAVRAGSGEVPEHERFAIGGARSLRGYREEQFRTAAAGDATVEWRLLAGRRNRLFLFADGAVIARGERDVTWAIERQDRWLGKLGYGAGVRIASRIGVVGVDYALGDETHFPRGRIHITVESSF